MAPDRLRTIPMMNKETWAMRAARMLEEAKMRGTVKEGVQNRLQWEDWGALLPELIDFGKMEIGRRKWRGSKAGVLPEGFDANSVAAEAVLAALKVEARLAPGWTRERLMNELKRKVSNEVRRLHKLKERREVRSEWDVLVPAESGELRSVFDWMVGRSLGGGRSPIGKGSPGWDDQQVQDKVRKETEQRIAEALRGEEAKLFGCLRAGLVKRRVIATRLGMSVTEVTNCRKRLDRKLDELQKAGCPGWVIEEWKKK